MRCRRTGLLQHSVAELDVALTEARSVIDELKRNPPQDLAMLSAGLAEIRRLLAA